MVHRGLLLRGLVLVRGRLGMVVRLGQSVMGARCSMAVVGVLVPPRRPRCLRAPSLTTGSPEASLVCPRHYRQAQAYDGRIAPE